MVSRLNLAQLNLAELKLAQRYGFMIAASSRGEGPAPQRKTTKARQELTPAELAAIAAIPAPAKGRPPIYPDKPWKALGISRVTWWKRRKQAEAMRAAQRSAAGPEDAHD